MGGSFLDGQSATCSAKLDGFGPMYSSPWTGFRCCSAEAVEPTGSGLGGDPVRPPVPPFLSSGAVTVVHVVRSGCSACARSTLALSELQASSKSLPIAVVGLGMDQRETEKILEPSGLRSVAVADEEGRWTGALRVVEVPTTLVLDQAGTEQARMEGFSRFGWADVVEALQTRERR